MIKIKMCGITNVEDALWAVNVGAQYIGLNFYPQSPRKVSVKMAKDIVSKTPPFCSCVGVFVNEPLALLTATATKSGIRMVQLHGDEDSEYIASVQAAGLAVIKAVRLKNETSIAQVGEYAKVADEMLLDAYVEDQPGGTGVTAPWELARMAREQGVRFFLAGGLTPENVAEAVALVRPYGVDVASGIERSPKKKDFEKMKSFVMKVKQL